MNDEFEKEIERARRNAEKRRAAKRKAIERLPFKPIFPFEDREIHVVLILDQSPPLVAPWWRGKQVHILGADVDGNFFLRHCDGSVRYWEHAKQTDTIVAKSEREFLAALREDVNDTLSWWKREDPGSDK